MTVQHHDIMKTGTENQKSFSESLIRTVNTFLKPGFLKDLQIMKLLKNVKLTERRKGEILDVFRDHDKVMENYDLDRTDLIDIMNPHPLSYFILRDFVRELTMSDERTYTKKYGDVTSDTYIWSDKHEDPFNQTWWHPIRKIKSILGKGSEENVVEEPIPYRSEFNTGLDELMHMKFVRLMSDYYGLNIYSEEGLAIVDNIVQTYDVSPGDPFLDRPHPVPMPAHTYNELPIIKYDGYETADWTVPEKDDIESVTAPIEARLREFVQLLNKSSGQNVQLSDIKEANKLTPEQYAILRTTLNLEVSDYKTIEKLKKIWGTMLPDSEIEALFFDQRKKFDQIEKESHH